MWKKLITWWAECSYDMRCHNSENWPQQNGIELTLELRINCTQNSWDDTIRPWHDQFEDDCQSWLLFLHVAPLLLSIKALAPLAATGQGRRSRLLDKCLSPSPPVVSIWNKANFPFYQPGLFIGFWAVSSQTTHILLVRKQPVRRFLFLLRVYLLNF